MVASQGREDRTESVLDNVLDRCPLFRRKGIARWVSFRRHRAVTGGAISRSELTWEDGSRSEDER